MATAIKSGETTIGLWYDETSDPESPAWIVSRDTRNADGSVQTTNTIEWRNTEDHEDAYAQAKAVAVTRAQKDRVRVLETGEHGEKTCVYDPAQEKAERDEVKCEDVAFTADPRDQGQIVEASYGWLVTSEAGEGRIVRRVYDRSDQSLSYQMSGILGPDEDGDPVEIGRTITEWEPLED